MQHLYNCHNHTILLHNHTILLHSCMIVALCDYLWIFCINVYFGYSDVLNLQEVNKWYLFMVFIHAGMFCRLYIFTTGLCGLTLWSISSHRGDVTAYSTTILTQSNVLLLRYEGWVGTWSPTSAGMFPIERPMVPTMTQATHHLVVHSKVQHITDWANWTH